VQCRIPYAQPGQSIPYAIKGKSELISPGVYCCGDHRGGATLNGAIQSGRKAARAILRKQKSAVINSPSQNPSGVILKDIPVEASPRSFLTQEAEEGNESVLQAQQAVAKSFITAASSASISNL